MSDTPKAQHDRFIETARALGCDEDEAAFDEKLKMIAHTSLSKGSKGSDPSCGGAKSRSKRGKPSP